MSSSRRSVPAASVTYTVIAANHCPQYLLTKEARADIAIPTIA
ncbi:hypothetical protein R1X32_11670 (plasmid) [Rhodococcus opacus]